MMKVAPSLLSCDFTNMGSEIKRIEGSGADMVHLDIMDGHFVPNITFGPMVVNALRGLVRIPFDVHLMVSDPLYYSNIFAKCGADIITFHIESDSNLEETIKSIHSHKKKAGISIKPGTPAEAITEYIKDIEMVLIMTVEPGFGGQKFMYDQVQKIRTIREIANRENHEIMIEVDGGINEETSKVCREAGADICVAGTSVFKSGDISLAIKRLRGD